jgi:hypothetical protein
LTATPPQKAGPVGGDSKPPEYLAWLDERPDRDYTILMGANTYRLMYGFAAESEASESDERTNEDDAMAELTRSPEVVFSSTLEDPWRGPIPSSSERIQSRLWER